MPRSPNRPFPYDKIPDYIIKAICKDEGGRGPAGRFPREKYYVTFAGMLIQKGIAVPETLISFIGDAESVNLLDDIPHSSSKFYKVVDLYFYYRKAVDPSVVDYILNIIIANIDEITKRKRNTNTKYDYLPTNHLIYLLTQAIKSSTAPFPEKFINLCKKHFEVAQWFFRINYQNGSWDERTKSGHDWDNDPRLVELKKILDYDKKLKEYDEDLKNYITKRDEKYT